MKRLLIATAMVAVVAAALPSMASAATITFSGSTSVTGNLTAGSTANFVSTLVNITCTTHSIAATPRNLSRRDSTNTSLVIDSGAGNTYGGCTYTTLIGSGNVRVTNSCGWILTAATTTTGTITIPSGCTRIDFTSGVISGCEIRIDAQSVSGTISSRTGPTSIEITVSRAPVTFTTNGRCAGTSRGSANQTERVTVPTVGLSAG